MLISELNVEQMSRNEITGFLFGDGLVKPDKTDCIFVFGGRGEERVSTAVQLFRSGIAPVILFAGGTKYGAYETPLAVTMRNAAVSTGVPDSNVLVATNSNNTKEDVIESLQVLDSTVGLHNLRKMSVVSIPWHMRRCLLTLRAYAPSWIEYEWVPASYEEHQPDNWYHTPEVERCVFREARNLVEYVRSGQLQDEDVD